MRQAETPNAETTMPGLTTYRILWGHSGEQGRQWTTALEAAQYAAAEWGTVEAPDAESAVAIVGQSMAVGDWYLDGTDLHVIPDAYVECIVDPRAQVFRARNRPPVPPATDDEAWDEIGKRHASSCEWVETRAHSIGCGRTNIAI